MTKWETLVKEAILMSKKFGCSYIMLTNDDTWEIYLTKDYCRFPNDIVIREFYRGKLFVKQ